MQENTPVVLQRDPLVVGVKTTFKVNSLLMTTGLESFYYEPNSILEANGWKGVPSDVEAEVDPLTRAVKVKTKANKIEGE